MLFLVLSVLEDDQRRLVEKIYRDNHQLFLKIANRITGSERSAEEALSEALLKISLNIQRISELQRNELTAFCVTIVKNCAYDQLRESSHMIPASDEDMQDVKSHEPTPEETVIQAEEKASIRKLLETLSLEEKELLEMRYTYEMQYSEIARRLSITEEAAKKRGQRVIQKLRKIYEDKSDEYNV